MTGRGGLTSIIQGGGGRRGGGGGVLSLGLADSESVLQSVIQTKVQQMCECAVKL